MKINELSKHYGDEVTIQGFIDNIRNLQYVIFMIIRDETGKVQVTIEKSDMQELVNIVEELTVESTVKITGTINESPKVKLNGMELIPKTIEVTSKNNSDLPFNFKDLESVNLDTRLDYRFIDLRNDRNLKIFQIESAFVKHLRDYLYNNNFIEIHTPKLIGAASESGSEVFKVKYFDKDAYLAQSPQFFKQMAMASGFGKIFEVAPAFRAENSNTTRHATEFTSFDVELSYIDSFLDVMNIQEEMLTYALKKLKEEFGDYVKENFNEEIIVPTSSFPKMKLVDVYNELESRYGYKVNESEKNDLTTEAEKLTRKLAKDLFDSEFLFVYDFPAEKRAFYHMRDKDGVLQGYDLIWRGVEITTGAQREHRYEEIVKNAKEKGLGKDVEFYLDFFKYGCPPHGGFGMGIDRLIMLLLGIPSIKESEFLFRGPNRLNP